MAPSSCFYYSLALYGLKTIIPNKHRFPFYNQMLHPLGCSWFVLMMLPPTTIFQMHYANIDCRSQKKSYSAVLTVLVMVAAQKNLPICRRITASNIYVAIVEYMASKVIFATLQVMLSIVFSSHPAAVLQWLKEVHFIK